MGGSESHLNIESHVWKTSNSHEIFSNVYDRNLSLVTYEPNEYISLGKLNLDYFKKNFNNEFKIEEKGWNFYDGVREKYNNDIIESCCLKDNTYKIEDEKIKTCPVFTQNLNNNLCDQSLYNNCFEKNINNKNCTLWIRNVVEMNKITFFNKIKTFVMKEENRNHPFSQIFLESLRDYNNLSNNYNLIADSIIDSYSNDIKFEEYKCSFPPDNIIKIEQDNNLIPRECWYKECVLTPLYKLKSENIYKNKLCHIQICDINIEQLNISNNEIEIKCLNKYNNRKIENIENIPMKVDQENLFYVPTFLNTVFPFFLIFLFLFF